VSLLKQEILTLLEKQSYDKIISLSLSDKRKISMLISLTYDRDNKLSWRAMEAIGLVTREISKNNPEAVRNIVGRLLWMIRDESGGIGWSVPDILGEIVRNNPVLCADIAPIIASSHEEIMLTGGVLRAIGRIGRINTDTVSYAIPIVISYLHSEDAAIRGSAVWALGEIGNKDNASGLEALKQDRTQIAFYMDGEIQKTSVGDLASEAMNKLLKL
jgi:HEAT repeat protein